MTSPWNVNSALNGAMLAGSSWPMIQNYSSAIWLYLSITANYRQIDAVCWKAGVQTNKKAPHYWPNLNQIHPWPVDFPHKEKTPWCPINLGTATHKCTHRNLSSPGHYFGWWLIAYSGPSPHTIRTNIESLLIGLPEINVSETSWYETVTSKHAYENVAWKLSPLCSYFNILNGYIHLEWKGVKKKKHFVASRAHKIKKKIHLVYGHIYLVLMLHMGLL